MKPKKLLPVLICSLALSPVCALGLTNNTKAVTLSDLNASEVFVKQQESDTCTLASNVMLLRRAALLRGDSNWQSITEGACRSTLWVEGCGMRFSYSYNGISVNCGRIYGDSTETLKQLLREHPEGVVAYDYDHPHAIMLTGYSDGVFYCSDPARCCGYGIIDARDSLIDTAGVEAYWYVTSSLPAPDSGSSGYSFTSGNNSSQYELINNSSLSSYQIVNGQKVTIYGDASNGTGDYVFTYQYRKSGQSQWTTIGQAKTDSTSVKFLPHTSTDFDIRVIAEDSNGVTSEKILNMSVSGGQLENTSSISDDEIIYGNSVDIYFGAVSGWGGVQYEVDVKKPSLGDYIRLKNYTGASSLTYRPWESGTYSLRINAKAASGKIDSKTVSFTVRTQALENYSETDTDYMDFGEDLTFSFSSVGGAGGLSYEVQAIKPSGNDWITLRKNCTASSFVYHPWEAGTYQFRVIASDNSGSVSTRLFSLYVNAEELKNLTYLDNTVVSYGSDLMIRTAATGGTASYRYEMNIKKPSSNEWINLRKYNPCGSEFRYHPWERGTYQLCVNLKDSSGNISTRYFTFEVV